MTRTTKTTQNDDDDEEDTDEDNEVVFVVIFCTKRTELVPGRRLHWHVSRMLRTLPRLPLREMITYYHTRLLNDVSTNTS